MSTDLFFQKIRSYHPLSDEAEQAWGAILHEKAYKRGERLLSEGQQARKVAFVVKGLLSQHYTSDDGSVVIKYFFPEQRLAASVSSMLGKAPSLFAITAIENTTVLEYDFGEFKKLTQTFADVAAFYIAYMELHWIIEKEPYEISLRHDSARVRYDAFVRKYPQLIKRLKKHHIASYLGITPTQLSRILLAAK